MQDYVQKKNVKEKNEEKKQEKGTICLHCCGTGRVQNIKTEKTETCWNCNGTKKSNRLHQFYKKEINQHEHEYSKNHAFH